MSSDIVHGFDPAFGAREENEKYGRKTPDTDYGDPFVLLRKAKELIEAYEGPEFEAWLAEYEKLAGVGLSVNELHVLRHSQFRIPENRDAIEVLWEKGLFKEVCTSGGRPWGRRYHLRPSRPGKDAIRLFFPVRPKGP